MFIKRSIESQIYKGAQQAPLIAIIGPRQSGKSTLARQMFKDYLYVDMQDAELFDFANKDPKGFLNTYKGEHGVILDEVQYAPRLFSQLKVEVDKNPRPGYYVLSGSQNFLLHEKISESLAGRVYLYTLLPFSIKELKNAHMLYQRAEDQILKGFYPRVYQPHIDAHDYYQNYISTYIERDIRMIKNIENSIVFKKFMQLCALRIGTTINFTDLARDCGISINTAKNWISLLEASFILFLLPSYHNNLGKRITKSPKLYFYDVGVVSTLIGTTKEMFAQKRTLYGLLFENMIVVDILKNCGNYGLGCTLTFFRDTNNNEVDLIVESQGKTTPIEIKASETMDSAFFNTLTWFQEQTNNDQKPIVIYGGNQAQTRTKGRVIPWNCSGELLP